MQAYSLNFAHTIKIDVAYAYHDMPPPITINHNSVRSVYALNRELNTRDFVEVNGGGKGALIIHLSECSSQSCNTDKPLGGLGSLHDTCGKLNHTSCIIVLADNDECNAVVAGGNRG